ncbi:DUF3141 domain-containing protein [Alcaligenes parafaecalis]|uniref:DUF3141 domain-containing protein n=2 Tax=Alcaligenes parafaecalis TaxID=171260 RepID=A0ABT3VW08_9BURK|nr:DUF3141 domain-containing protein [Alcaligenes parafaecalis]MCX5465938.1 DUF3141 domain-containing protein [Alcaligenes parafaecalis]
MMTDKSRDDRTAWSPWNLGQTVSSYFVDAWQRAILYADIERQVGDQYQAQRKVEVPNVLNFPAELVMSGLTLPRPVNYLMVRILAPEDQPTDPSKRPFLVVDPRAGHGPGIGGFKSDSEIGAALQAGHPCYFVGFLPDPVPGQTVEDVMRAHAAFVSKAAELHPESQGKPVVIGNCQAGWQIMMAAAVWPELFGPLILAGAPVSYWAGRNPMRYAGGLLGGSWLTAMTSDLGNGRFDGAWLVKNFENLDPANTLWSKQYNVYANADTEAERYIGFEKYWGGYVFLNDVEMQYIVDNLFIGNKLSTAQLMTSDGIRIDLRNIRSPIVVFSSFGDNITPPAQALGWITDLYLDDDDVRSHDQTIVFTTHDRIGHLGIFVSGSVGSKEHRKFASTIDQIDLLPAGIYRATVEETPDDDTLLNDPYLMSVRQSNLAEIAEIVQPDPESDRRFAAAARLSEINLAFYKSTLQPWVKALSTPYTAALLEAVNPMRLSYESWTSAHPWAATIHQWAENIAQQRQTVDEDNIFLEAQENFSQAMERVLNNYRDRRDSIYQIWFDTVYGSPLLMALAGHAPGDSIPARPHPGSSPEHLAFVRQQMHRLDGLLNEGGLLEAALRGLFHIAKQRNSVDERYHHAAMRLREQYDTGNFDIEKMRAAIREQALVLAHHGHKAVEAIPHLLSKQTPEEIRLVASLIKKLISAIDEQDPASEAVTQASQEVLGLFEAAAKQQEQAEKSSHMDTKTVAKTTASAAKKAAAPAPVKSVAQASTAATATPVKPGVQAPKATEAKSKTATPASKTQPAAKAAAKPAQAKPVKPAVKSATKPLAQTEAAVPAQGVEKTRAKQGAVAGSGAASKSASTGAAASRNRQRKS